VAASFLRDASARSHPSFTDREDLLGQVHTVLRPGTTAELSSVQANSGQGELTLPEQESLNQVRLEQIIAQYLQKLILENIGTVVFVVLNSNVGSRSSSIDKSLCQRHTPPREDCYDEYPPLRRTLRQRQGA
jgi:hypothetical protein